VQILALAALYLPDQDRLSPVNLVNDIVHHNPCLVVLELACFKVLERTLDCPGTIVFALYG
jgi:hypothetical protein